jgi:hypothetical protein
VSALKHTPRMAEILAARQAQRDEQNAAREASRTEREQQRARMAETITLATNRGEDVTQDGERVRIARDGLAWLRDKRGLPGAYFFAGLRFRADYELANGTGVLSCLNDEKGGGFASGSGPSDAMLRAKDATQNALAALGTPLLHPYAIHVAGEGRMLTDPVFEGDQRSHYVPAIVALDLLARHYGMIR